MKRLSSSAREALSNFSLMLLVNLSYEGLHKLKTMGQSVTELWIDSIAIATLFTLFMYIWRLRDSAGDRKDP